MGAERLRLHHRIRGVVPEGKCVTATYKSARRGVFSFPKAKKGVVLCGIF